MDLVEEEEENPVTQSGDQRQAFVIHQPKKSFELVDFWSWIFSFLDFS